MPDDRRVVAAGDGRIRHARNELEPVAVDALDDGGLVAGAARRQHDVALADVRDHGVGVTAKNANSSCASPPVGGGGGRRRRCRLAHTSRICRGLQASVCDPTVERLRRHAVRVRIHDEGIEALRGHGDGHDVAGRETTRASHL